MKKLLLSLLCLAGLSASAQTSFELITTADALTAGAEYILVGEAGTSPEKYYAMINKTKNSGAVTAENFRLAEEVTPENGVIKVAESSDISVFTLDAGSSEGFYAIKGTVGYITFTGTNTGKLKEVATLATDGTADFKLTFESNGGASFNNVKYSERYLRFNFNDGTTPRFANYASSMSCGFLYKKVEGSGPVVARPTFSVAGGDIAKGTEVEISCATEGAKIYYTLDNTEPAETSTEYTAPIAINETCTLKAIAVKDADKSSVASVTYTVLEPITLAEANKLAKGKTFIMGSDLTVVYFNSNAGGNVYVYDPVGKVYSLIYKFNLGLKEGDVIVKGWAGKMDVYNGLPELVPASDITISGTAEVPAFAVVEADKITNALVNQPVIVNGVTFAAATPSTNTKFDGTVGDATLAFYNKFKLASVAAGDYDVTAIVSINDSGSTTLGTTVNLFPISIVKATDGIADIEAEAAGEAVYYNLQGVRVENPVNGLFIEVRGNKAVKVVK